MLLSERQAAEEARKARSDAEARNAELNRNLEDAEKKVDQLQESAQRYVDTSDSGIILLCCIAIMELTVSFETKEA